MELSSRQAEQIIAQRFGVGEKRLLRFRGRLDRLRKLGCPRGVNTGKGRPAKYQWPQLLELSVAVSLLDIGLLPEHVATAISENAEDLHLALSNFLARAEENGLFTRALAAGDWPSCETLLLVGSSHSIATMDERGEAPHMIVDFVEQSDLADWLADLSDPLKSTFLIDLGSMLIALIAQLSTLGVGPTMVSKAIATYADEMAENLLTQLDDAISIGPDAPAEE